MKNSARRKLTGKQQLHADANEHLKKKKEKKKGAF